jgi:sulfatase maturation enzyme AslB (radical SAM superfamily)
MDDLKLKKVCPLPWLHFSAHLDSTMRICCNTDGPGFVLDDNGKTLKVGSVDDINAYFNLNYYKQIRSQMLKGEEPEQCRKCYEVEHHGGASVRQGYLSLYSRNETFLKSIDQTDPKTGEINPTVQSLDFSLSNSCNLKCVMCSPSASYIIKQDYDKLGLDYSKEFAEGAHTNWKKLPELDKIIGQIAPTLEDFLTTGGEPFLNPEHYRILELLVASGQSSKVNLSYHTNCTIRNDKLFEIWHNFKSVSVHFSIDAYGPLNEYIRFKTQWKDVEENVQIMLNHPKTRCEVHTTVQALNILNLVDLYEWMSSIKGIPKLPYHIWMDQPDWLRMDALPPKLLKQAYLKLFSYFTDHPAEDHNDKIRQEQILSYLKRSINSYQGEKMTELFAVRLRNFEEIRKQTPVERLVPELSEIFSK